MILKKNRLQFFLYFLVIVVTIIVSGCFSSSKMYDRSLNRNKNVCKKLCGNVLIYIVFVDCKGNPKFTDSTIQETLIMYKEAAKWAEQEAKKNNVKLSIQINTSIPNVVVEKDFPVKNAVKMPIFEKATIKKINDWTNQVSKKAGENMSNKKENDSLPSIINPINTERLVARLRNQYTTESVALFFETNHSGDNEIKLPLNTIDNNNVECVINSYKNSSVIAYELLSLFGAEKLHYSKFGHSNNYAEFAAKEFPDDLMVNPFRNLNSANIGQFTKYLIGWSSSVDKKYFRLFKN